MTKKEVLIPMALAKYALPIIASEKQSIKIIPQIHNDPLPDRTSKLLGIPYWPRKEIEYPKDKQNKPMRLIAQINLAEIQHLLFNNEELNIFPKKGMLQFFISQYSHENKYSDLTFEKKTTFLNDISVIYHDSIELPNLITKEIIAINLEHNNYLPIFQQYKLDFFTQEEFCPLIDSYSSHYYYENFINNLNKEEINEFYTAEEFSSQGIKIGGYPSFIQKDPRTEVFDINNPWILLLQIDFTNKDNQQTSTWKDSKIANWFIKKEDLINKDFSKVFFFWDCL